MQIGFNDADNARWTPPPSRVAPGPELLRSLMRHKLLFALTTSIVMCVAVAITVAQKPRYTATGTVVVRPEAGDPLLAINPRTGDRLDDSAPETITATLRSRELARSVVEQLKIGGDAKTGERRLCQLIPLLKSFAITSVFCKQRTESERLSEEIDTFLDRLQVRPLPRSRVLSISYTDGDPELTAESVNLLVNLQQQRQLAEQTADLNRTADWLERRTEELRNRWLAAERKAGEALGTEDMLMTSASGATEPLVAKQIASAAGDYSQARAQLAAAEARAAALARVSGGDDRLAFVRVVDEPLLVATATRLNELNTRRAQLVQTVGPRHPDVLAVAGQIAEAEEKFNAERARVVRAIRDDVAIKRAQVDSLDRNLAGLRSQGAAASTRIVAARALDREASSARTVYETFLERTKQIADRASILQPSLQFVSRAEMPTSPSGPAVSRFLAIGGLVGVAAGAAMALLREYLATGFLNINRVNEVLGLPILAAVPFIPRWRRVRVSLSDYVLKRPFSIAAESMRSVSAHALLARTVGQKGQSLMITSATAGEGKSTICHWLSTSCAKSGYSVLLIDGDHRKPLLSRRGRRGQQCDCGLTDWLMGRALIDQIVQHDQVTGVARICPGSPMPGPFGHYELQRLKALLIVAKERYDLVIIDSPPMLATAENLIYANLVDHTVLASEWKQANHDALVSARDHLRKVNANCLGVIVTMVRMKSFTQYSDERRTLDTRLLEAPYETVVP